MHAGAVHHRPVRHGVLGHLPRAWLLILRIPLRHLPLHRHALVHGPAHHSRATLRLLRSLGRARLPLLLHHAAMHGAPHATWPDRATGIRLSARVHRIGLRYGLRLLRGGLGLGALLCGCGQGASEDGRACGHGTISGGETAHGKRSFLWQFILWNSIV
jgi:hypothetical protein